MGGTVVLITSFLVLLVTMATAAENGTICKASPTWRIENEDPMAGTLGQVTVLALLQASCRFCLTQAANMGPLRDKLSTQGLTNISYIILNDQSFFSLLLYPELKRRAPAGVPVYQQLPSQPEIWEILNGNKDDFLIYDRCGRLTFHIRLPYSYLHYPYVEAAIRFTYNNDVCGNCSFYPNSTQQMMNTSAVFPISTRSPETPAPTIQLKELLNNQPDIDHSKHHHHKEAKNHRPEAHAP
ncbi:selenoprotein Pb [Bombina bombina]|uniref:selenoprotein Pb n=1 Tax=Bombina bombina TaxID=8345 RepID=UPI00235B2499|nr:selenoprotein Pb [Bombina bombina]